MTTIDPFSSVITPELASYMNSRFRVVCTALISAVAAYIAPFALDAQQVGNGGGNGQGRPVASVVRITTTPPTIDGRLDDDAWSLNLSITHSLSAHTPAFIWKNSLPPRVIGGGRLSGLVDTQARADCF